jgi:hypothetical protein
MNFVGVQGAPKGCEAKKTPSIIYFNTHSGAQGAPYTFSSSFDIEETKGGSYAKAQVGCMDIIYGSISKLRTTN